MKREIIFQSVLDSLLDDSHPFPPRYLHLLSDLEPVQLNSLMAVWPQISLARRRALLEDLEQLAEVDTLLCYDNLARALLKDPDALTRVLAIRLLWECEDTKLVPIFLDIMKKDDDVHTRAAASTALGLFVYLGELEEIPAKIYHNVEDRLLEAIHSADEILVRRRALEALGTSSRPEVPPLIEAAYAEKNPDWIVSALFAMGRSSDTRWEKQIISKLRSKDEAIRVEATRAAGELSLQAARPILLDLLADEVDNETRREIIWALSKIGGEGVRDRLEELLAMAEDDEEEEFLDEALDNLDFTENMSTFEMFDFDIEEDDKDT